MQFETYVPEILKMCHHSEVNIRLKAVRTLAFVSACTDLHNTLIDGDALTIVLDMLHQQPPAGVAEAGLVFFNHICDQDKNDKLSKDYITRFFREKNRFQVLLRYTSSRVYDKVSIVINAICALNSILNDRLAFQERAIDDGLLPRLMELQQISLVLFDAYFQAF